MTLFAALLFAWLLPGVVYILVGLDEPCVRCGMAGDYNSCGRCR